MGGHLPDLVRPNRLTIIDYLAPDATGMWKIAELHEQLNAKIDNGIILVAMQKAKGRDVAFGGDFSAQVPSVFISIDEGLAKITKAKEYDDEKVSDPKGKIMSFTLSKGFHFESQDYWHRKEDTEVLPKYPDPYGTRKS